jgi:plasmid maintenance system killer protein
MKAHYSEEILETLPANVRKAFFKQLKFLEQNLRHPSLRAKKYDEANDLWQARVNKDWRFYFVIKDDTYYIVDVVPHPK